MHPRIVFVAESLQWVDADEQVNVCLLRFACELHPNFELRLLGVLHPLKDFKRFHRRTNTLMIGLKIFYRIFHAFHIKLRHFQIEQIRTVESARFTAAIGFGTLLVADIGGRNRKSPGIDRTVATVFKK